MISKLTHFLFEDDGAVTVDWVVLTAAIVGIAVAVLTAVGGSTTGLATKIGDEVEGLEVATY